MLPVVPTCLNCEKAASLLTENAIYIIRFPHISDEEYYTNSTFSAAAQPLP